jgi:hypothetical protein
MARPAQILLVGTLAAILPSGAAISQTDPSWVLNNQVQLGDVFSQQTLNVVGVSDQTVATTTATGNAFQANAELNDADMRSNQSLQGDVAADTRVNVTGYSGDAVVLTTAASGNTGHAGAYGATMTGVYTQITGQTSVSAHSHVEAPSGSAGNVDSVVQAVGNSQSFGLGYASAGVRANQTNEASVTSDGGGVYGYVSGIASFTATTSANDVSLSGENLSAARLAVSQTNAAPLTQAAQFTAFGNVQESVTAATAAGNNVTAHNEGPLLDIASQQTNQSYVRAQSAGAAYLFGAAAASAYGVGNSLSAGAVGGEIVLDTVQINDGGGVEALAAFSGTEGYDARASATAMGNSITGFACSDCGGRMTVGNSQTNYSDIGAQSTVEVAGSGRSVQSVSTAVGNSATYYVTRPE